MTGICLAHSTQLVTYVIVGNDRLGSMPDVILHHYQLDESISNITVIG